MSTSSESTRLGTANNASALASFPARPLSLIVGDTSHSEKRQKLSELVINDSSIGGGGRDGPGPVESDPWVSVG